MNKLLRNERFKLYKKPSTWILIGIVVGLMGLVLLAFHISTGGYDNYYRYEYTYADALQSSESQLKHEPGNEQLKLEVEKYRYLVTNQISSGDWRADVVEWLYAAKSMKLSLEGQLANIGKDDPDQYRHLMEQIEEQHTEAEKWDAILQKNDWRQFIELKLNEAKQAQQMTATPQNQAEAENLQMQLDMNIEPVSEQAYYGGAPQSKDSWKNELLANIKANRIALLSGESQEGELLTSNKRAQLEREVNVARERLETDAAPVQMDSFLGQLDMGISLISLISILIMVLAGGIVSSEFGTGTVKLLLITPHKRSKIYWAKAILMLEVTLITAAAMFVVAFLLSAIFNGFSGIGDMQVLVLFGKVVHIPYMVYILFKFVVFLLPVLVFGAMALMLSTVTRKSAVAIAVSILLMYGSGIVLSLISAFTAGSGGTIPGLQFLVFSNTSLGLYFNDATSSMGAAFGGLMRLVDPSMTLGFSVAILLVYLVCFLWIGRDSFCRRDIK